MHSKNLIKNKGLIIIYSFFFNKNIYYISSINRINALCFVSNKGFIFNINIFVFHVKEISFLLLKKNYFLFFFLNYNMSFYIKRKFKGLLFMPSNHSFKSLIYCTQKSGVIFVLDKLPYYNVLSNIKSHNFYSVGLLDGSSSRHLFDSSIVVPSLDHFFPCYFFTLFLYNSLI